MPMEGTANQDVTCACIKISLAILATLGYCGILEAIRRRKQRKRNEYSAEDIKEDYDENTEDESDGKRELVIEALKHSLSASSLLMKLCIKEGTKDAVDSIKETAENAKEKVLDLFEDIVDCMKSSADDAAEAVKGAVEMVTGKTQPEDEVSIRVNTSKDPGDEDSNQREIDTSLTIERDRDKNALHIELGIVIDPESDKPMNLKIEAEVDNDTVEVSGEAAGNEKGTAHIEVETERNGEPLHSDQIDLDIKEKDKDSDSIELKPDDFKIQM